MKCFWLRALLGWVEVSKVTVGTAIEDSNVAVMMWHLTCEMHTWPNLAITAACVTYCGNGI